MTNKNEQEKKKSYIAPAMEILKMYDKAVLLVESNNQDGMHMVIH